MAKKEFNVDGFVVTREEMVEWTAESERFYYECSCPKRFECEHIEQIEKR